MFPMIEIWMWTDWILRIIRTSQTITRDTIAKKKQNNTNENIKSKLWSINIELMHSRRRRRRRQNECFARKKKKSREYLSLLSHVSCFHLVGLVTYTSVRYQKKGWVFFPYGYTRHYDNQNNSGMRCSMVMITPVKLLVGPNNIVGYIIIKALQPILIMVNNASARNIRSESITLTNNE